MKKKEKNIKNIKNIKRYETDTERKLSFEMLAHFYLFLPRVFAGNYICAMEQVKLKDNNKAASSKITSQAI